MRWIIATVLLANLFIVPVTGQCGNNRVCPDSCHCSDTSFCPDPVSRRCGTGGRGECAQPWSGPTCRRKNLVLNRRSKYVASWNKSSVQRSTVPKPFAFRMFDGNASTFWLSKRENDPWIWVKVPTYPEPVHSMRIYIKEGVQFSKGIKGLLIEVSNETTLGTGEICYTDNSSSVLPIYEINCTRPMVGRYVFITRPGFVQLKVHEFEVYGCENSWFGYQCDQKCNCANSTEVCDKISGTCDSSGCSPGYMGVDCNTTVPEEVAAVGPVVGGIVGLCVLVALVITVLIILRRRRPKGSDTPDGTAMREKRGVQSIDPEDGDDNGVVGFAEDGVTYVNTRNLPTPSTRVSLSDLTAYVAQRLEERKPFENEFLNLPQGLLETCEEAQKPANVKKCRYMGMLPYDHTRVALEAINNDPYSDFINANYINGYSQKKAYVASQGTTSQNMGEFWRMVWTIHAGKIVMLSGLFEGGKFKVERYWPDEHAKKTYGDIQVETMDIQNLSDCCIRTFKVQRAVKVRTVKQFQYLAWPDHDVPSDTSGILNLRDRVKFANDTHDGPVIVHCSAGVGRTGTYICFDYLMDKLERENELDIFQCVSDLRHQRTQMVQTPEQYAFLHMLVNDGVLCRDSKFTTDDFLSLDINSGVFQERNHDQYERMQKFVHLPMRNRTTSTLDSPGQDEDLGQEYVPRTANRVWLSTIANGKNDSIDAVYVLVTKDGHELIATQSPTTDNAADFWRMIYERKCTTIAMLCMEQKKNDPPQVVRHICLTALGDDLDIPSGESILEMKELIEDWHRQIEPGHVVIHCRNGSDQTGLICVALEIIERIQTEQWVNMMVAVKRVRTACPKAVISLEQYRFCYNLVKTYLDRFTTYANFA